MAALCASATTSVWLAFRAPEVAPRRRRRAVHASAAHSRRSLFTLTMNSSGPEAEAAPASGSEPVNLPGLPIPNLPPWATWLVGAIFFAVPMYRRMRALEDQVEQTAKVAIEVVDQVAEATERVAGEVADAFPENQAIKNAAARIKAVADEIEEDTEKAEALIEKVDEIKKQVDSIVDPIIDRVAKGKPQA